MNIEYLNYADRYDLDSLGDNAPLPFADCDANGDAHEAHTYRALNGRTYRCPGLTQSEVDALEAAANDLCEHGMSAALCGGPMHWYD